MPEGMPTWPQKVPAPEVLVGDAVWIGDLLCECGLTLGGIFNRRNKTVMLAPALRSGGPVYLYRAQFVCPKCAAERSFYSVPMSAIRLGIVEAGG